MKRIALALALGELALLSATLPALAGSYTVTLENGQSFETRYAPRLGDGEVRLLTETGNWIALPRELVVAVAPKAWAGGYGRVMENSTIEIGWAPNDAPAEAPEAEPQDVATILLNHEREFDSLPVLDFTVPQFVNAEEITGGLPAGGSYLYDRSKPLIVAPWRLMPPGLPRPPLPAAVGVPPGE